MRPRAFVKGRKWYVYKLEWYAWHKWAVYKYKDGLQLSITYFKTRDKARAYVQRMKNRKWAV